MSFSRKIDRFPYVLGVLFLIATSGVLISEFFSLQWENYRYYAPVRAALMLAVLPLVVKFRKGAGSDLEIGSFFAIACLGCFWGSWFHANYELGYVQCALGAAFVMTKRKWIYPVVFGFGALLMVAGAYLRPYYGVEVTPMNPSDWIHVLVVFFAIGTVVNLFFFRERIFREEALFRFSTLGRQAIRIAHDLKGLMASPILHLEYLRENVGASSREDLVRSLESLIQDLDRMRTLVLQLNRMVLKEENLESVDLAALLHRVETFFGKRISGVRVHVPATLPLRVYEGRMQSVLFNLMLNSLEAFDAVPHPAPAIWLEKTASGFRYRDNAGGAPASVLSGLRKGAVISTKGCDRGLGLSFVQQDLQSMGGHAMFRNDPQGFVVEVEFKSF